MNRRSFFGAMALGLAGLAAGATGASAQIFGRPGYRDYRTYRYFRGYGSDDIRRREALRNRMFDLADRIREAQRDGILGPRGADRLYDKLDDVADFLREDRHLTSSEFDRRRDDLDDIARDLNRVYRNSPRYRGRRYRDDWYDRYDRRYRRDDRYYRY